MQFGALREDIFRSPTQRSGWAYMFSVCGAGLEDFCLFILKAHGLRSMGLLFLILTEKYSNILSISSSIMLLIN